MFSEDRNRWSSWTNLTSFHLNLLHVIWLPWKFYGLERLVSLLLFNRNTGKSRSAKSVESFVYLSLKSIMLSELSERNPLCSTRTTIETTIGQQIQTMTVVSLGVKDGKKDDAILIPMLLLMITTKKLLSWEEIPAPHNSLRKESKRQRSCARRN